MFLFRAHSREIGQLVGFSLLVSTYPGRGEAPVLTETEGYTSEEKLVFQVLSLGKSSLAFFVGVVDSSHQRRL